MESGLGTFFKGQKNIMLVAIIINNKKINLPIVIEGLGKVIESGI